MSAAKAVIVAAACALLALAVPGAHVVSAAVNAAEPAVRVAAELPPSESEAMQDLRDAIAAPDRQSYVGLVQTVEYGSAHADASVYRIEHRAPVLTRRWYLAPQSLYNDQIISRGDTTYNLDVRHKKLIVSRDDAIDDQVAIDDNFALLKKNYRAIPAPDETIAGRTAEAIVLVNRYTGQTVMRIWIDAQTRLVLQKERYAANGAVTYSTRFEQIRYTNDIPRAVFDVPQSGFDRTQGPNHGLPSNDLQAVVRAAGFDAKGPKYLPEGFVPVAGDVTDIKNIRTVHLLYSDGIRTVSLFENARGAAVDLSKFSVRTTKVENGDAQYVETGATTLLAWAHDALHYTLVGELSRDELVRIAASV
jgi:negative regulator of sigma E activity